MEIPARSPPIEEILNRPGRKPAPSRASIPRASSNAPDEALEDDEAMILDPPVPDPPEYAEAIATVRQAINATDDEMAKVDAQIRIEVAIANLRSKDEVYRSRGRDILSDILVKLSPKHQESAKQPALEQAPTAASNEDIDSMMASEMLGTPDST